MLDFIFNIHFIVYFFNCFYSFPHIIKKISMLIFLQHFYQHWNTVRPPFNLKNISPGARHGAKRSYSAFDCFCFWCGVFLHFLLLLHCTEIVAINEMRNILCIFFISCGCHYSISSLLSHHKPFPNAVIAAMAPPQPNMYKGGTHCHK